MNPIRTAERKQILADTFLRYARGLVVYARDFVGSTQEAEDIVHDVFVNYWERIDRLSDSGLKTYLFRSTRNSCLNYLDRRKRGSAYAETLLTEKRDYDPDPDTYIEVELEKIIREAIDRLPPQRRRVFVMNKLEGMSLAEIACELEISPKTADKHLQLAHRTLREDLGRYLYLLSMLYLGSRTLF